MALFGHLVRIGSFEGFLGGSGFLGHFTYHLFVKMATMS